MLLIAELAWKFVKASWKSSLAVTTRFSLAGIVLGVASLVVAMAVVSGFEQTLYESVARLNGHIQVRHHFSDHESYADFKRRTIDRYQQRILGVTPVLWVEALAIYKGATQGVLLQGLILDEARQILDFERVLRTTQELQPGRIWIGAGIAKKWGLDITDKVALVVPISDELNPQKLKRSFKIFEVQDVVSLGKHEYDERAIIMNLQDLQALAQVGTQLSGALIQSHNRNWAQEVKAEIQSFLGSSYRVQTWYDINSYLFEAIKIERYVIFFVILIIVIASSFNVGVSLWIGVLQKTRELSLFKSMGMKSDHIQLLMLFQGFILAAIGAAFGIFLGVLLSYGVDGVQSLFPVLPGSVYKIDHLKTQIRLPDLTLIIVSVVVLSGLSVFWPARTAAKQGIAEGLRYE